MDTEPNHYNGPERRLNLPLSDEQIEHIAEKAAEKAVRKMTLEAYQAIGRGVVNKAMWIIGVVATAALIWMAKAGHIKP